jgi:diguanylate cyclase (GGDEF)-like protein
VPVDPGPLTVPAVGAPTFDGLRRLRDVVASAGDLGHLLELAAEEARRAIGAAAVAISRIDHSDQTVRVLVNVGRLAAGEERFPANEWHRFLDHPSLRGRADSGAVSTSVHDPDGDPDAIERLKAQGRATELAVPIVTRSGLWGQLRAATAPGEPALTMADRDLLSSVARELADVIGYSEQLSNLGELAYTDPLTGLANRRRLDAALATAIDGANGGPWCLLLLDLDGLREHNELLGHDAGDTAIRRLAAAMRGALRTRTDAVAARLGGDDFAILLNEDAVGAFAVAGDIGAMWATGDAAVTVSCGIASKSDVVTSSRVLLRLADGALHAAKAEGRGRIVLSSAASVESETFGPGNGRAPYRAYRDRGWNGMGALLESVLAAFDGPLQEASVLERVARLAEACALSLRPRHWAISEVPPFAVDVVPVLEGVIVGRGKAPSPMSYPLARYPHSRIALDEERALVVPTDDRSAEQQAFDLARELGCDTVLVAGARVLNRAYLLELFGDTTSYDFGAALPAVRLLMIEAVHGANRIH